MLLNLRFKGERTYLHGTDMLDETVAWLAASQGELASIDFSFHRVASRQLEACLEPRKEGEPVAICAFTARGARARAYLYETDLPVSSRYACPEHEIASSMQFDPGQRKGVLAGDVSHSDIEIWVAMAKALHYRVFPGPAGKWLFARARLPRYVRHGGGRERSIVIAAAFSDRLTRSEIFRDGAPAGEIYFSVGHA